MTKSSASTANQAHSDDLIHALSQVHSVMAAQLQLVIDENLDSGDLLSETLGQALSDESMPDQLRNMLLPAFLRLQSRDIMQQQLVGLNKIIQQTQQAMLLFAKKPADENARKQCEKLPEAIYDTYVMKQQRATHRQALGLPVEEEQEKTDVDLDFF